MDSLGEVREEGCKHVFQTQQILLSLNFEGLLAECACSAHICRVEKVSLTITRPPSPEERKELH